jgi:hypothetical protein
LAYSLLADTQINYDTAWTFVYDGGKDSASGKVYQDKFFDLKSLPDGSCICAGYTGYSDNSSLLVKLNSSGKVVLKKTYTTTHARGQLNSQSSYSVFVAKNGDIIVGGMRYREPWVMRLDSAGNIKWTAWYYDSTQGVLGQMLTGGGTINSIRETSRGRIICAVGDEFPNGDGRPLNNYAAYLEFDSSGINKRAREWDNQVGVNIAGFNIDETRDHYFLLAGKKNVFFLDSTGAAKVKTNYSFMLDGVGSEENNITRAKELRDGTLMVAGQAYEGNCWTNWQKLYYDAWWSPINQGSGSNITWDTAGWQGGDDFLYDFTQLSDGRLVFVGKKYNTSSEGGVWTFVTDSTGKEILWEKQTKIIYRTTDGLNPRPFSVCATPDKGFTIAGEYGCLEEDGGMNAFAAHFIPAPPSGAANAPRSTNARIVNCTQTNSKVTFSFPQSTATPVELSIFNAAGKLVTRLSTMRGTRNSTALVWGSSRSARGVYYYQVKSNVFRANGKFMLN